MQKKTGIRRDAASCVPTIYILAKSTSRKRTKLLLHDYLTDVGLALNPLVQKVFYNKWMLSNKRPERLLRKPAPLIR